MERCRRCKKGVLFGTLEKSQQREMLGRPRDQRSDLFQQSFETQVALVTVDRADTTLDWDADSLAGS